MPNSILILARFLFALTEDRLVHVIDNELVVAQDSRTHLRGR